MGLSRSLDAAAALVADRYSLFLLGPMLLARVRAGDRTLVMEPGDPVRITEAGVDVKECLNAEHLADAESSRLVLHHEHQCRY